MASADPAARRHWMGVLAKARPEEIASTWSGLDTPPAYELLRPAEAGMIMVQGRIGGDGRAFNLGEMTVTRCSVRLTDGTVGHAWVAGRSTDHAEQAAVLDALLQDPRQRAALQGELERLAEAQAARHREAAGKSAATRVEFFTMVRGGD